MDRFSLHIVSPRGTDEFATVRPAGLGVEAFDGVTDVDQGYRSGRARTSRRAEDLAAPERLSVISDDRWFAARRVGDDLIVLGITLAVTEHRRRIAQLLGRLDALLRDAVESGVAALEAGTVDVGTLLAYFGDRLRAGDVQLSLLVDELERQRLSCTMQEEVRQ